MWEKFGFLISSSVGLFCVFVLLCTGCTRNDTEHETHSGKTVKSEPRFIDNNDGTVTDRHTGLVWLQNAHCFGMQSWVDAGFCAARLKDGMCDLTDGSAEGDWRLPTLGELQKLGTTPPTAWDMGVDFKNLYPPDPVRWTKPGTPFLNVQPDKYWSETKHVSKSDHVWYVHMSFGYASSYDKSITFCVLPVRPQN